jgi:hypothetical protein
MFRVTSRYTAPITVLSFPVMLAWVDLGSDRIRRRAQSGNDGAIR